jgi:D-lactate dehydrogenase
MSNEEIARALGELVGPAKVLTRLIERTAKAGDASIYRLTPRLVVQPATPEEMIQVLQYCRANGLYLTFRAAGTSLSGQAVTDGILVDISQAWKRMRVLDGGRRVAAEPGVIASQVNSFLEPWRVKIGPDPASINTCMIGGVAANNASGMCCGVEFNSYNTFSSMKLILADGTALDTTDPAADDQLRAARPDIYQGLAAIRDAIRANAPLADRIRKKFGIKNTCGYSMNAFVDFERPIDILSHVLIGSEGTLGFISEITYNTLPDKPIKATTLVYFQELGDAGRAVAPLERAGAAVLEIMDRASMLSVADDMQYPFFIGPYDPSAEPLLRREGHPDTIHSNCAALLVEFQEDDEHDAAAKLEMATAILNRFPLLQPVEFSRDPALRASYWHMRKGLYPSVGGMREIGTAVIIEDICVEPQYLAEAIEDVQGLFVRHSFPDAIIFGHARNGNIHFVICTDFADPEQVQRYAALMDELTRVVVEKYDGSLKAEHGTGRNIAPFVELEWGQEITALMWEVKRLLDPDNILSPGVVLTTDPQAHLKNLKVMPAVSPIVDKCIECGFCEPRCPSRNLTSTPRQRIAILREVERLDRLGDAASRATADQLLAEYEYYGNETCAADGMCATSCPVHINTGDMIKTLRGARHRPLASRMAKTMARHFQPLAWGARTGLAFVHYGGPPAMALGKMVMGAANKLSGGQIPRLPDQIPIPAPAHKLPRLDPTFVGTKVIYFATCLTRSMGAIPGEPSRVSVPEAVVSVARACGSQVVYPENLPSLCCGQPFFSKGFTDAGKIAADKTVDALWQASEQGRWTIICDTSPCTGQLVNAQAYLAGETLARWKKLRILDVATWLAREVIPMRETWPRLHRRVVLHPVCTVMKQGWTPELKKVAETFAEQVELPVLTECCGFAGDRGLLFPELTLSATSPESSEVRRKMGLQVTEPGDPCGDYAQASAARCAEAGQGTGCDTRYYSTCRTCEMGMSATTGEAYGHIIQLVYDALIQ